MVLTFFWVFVGAGVGGVLRYLVYLFASPGVSSGFPFATMIVNVVGSFLIGLLFILFQARFSHHLWFRPFFIVGILGGFTTFSAFSLDVWELFVSGNVFRGGLYIVSTVILCLLAVWLGVLVGPSIEKIT